MNNENNASSILSAPLLPSLTNWSQLMTNYVQIHKPEMEMCISTPAWFPTLLWYVSLPQALPSAPQTQFSPTCLLISLGPLTFPLLLVPLSRLGSREAALFQEGEGALEQTHYWCIGWPLTQTGRTISKHTKLMTADRSICFLFLFPFFFPPSARMCLLSVFARWLSFTQRCTEPDSGAG